MGPKSQNVFALFLMHPIHTAFSNTPQVVPSQPTVTNPEEQRGKQTCKVLFCIFIANGDLQTLVVHNFSGG